MAAVVFAKAVKGSVDVKIDATEMNASELVSSDQASDTSKKRKTRFSGDETKKRPKTGALSDLDKNACMLLNEKCRDVTFSVVAQVGPVHMPMFTMQATINGQTFVGSGPTKKRAKLAAAEAAVQALHLCAETENVSMEIKDEHTGDLGAAFRKPVAAVNQVSSNENSVAVLSGKHPVLMLNELRPRAEYAPLDDDSGLRKCKVTVDGETFEGSGINKKLAKSKAAEAALTGLFNLTFSYQADGQPVYQGDDSLWTRYKLKEPAASVDTVDGKNPIQILNELFLELKFENVDVSNEVTAGTKFCVSVEIHGKTYRGEGNTKKMAKNNCAMAAVRALMANGTLKNRLAEKEAKKRRTASRFSQGTGSTSFMDSAVIKLAVHFPDLQYRLISQNDLWNNGQTTYSVAVTVRGESFVASGPTEKAAKDQVASKVLTKFGLWSAGDKRMKEESSRVEADSTNTSSVRGTRGRGNRFRGRGFVGRGVGRGGNYSKPGVDVLSATTSGYSVSGVGGQLGSETQRSSEWLGSSTATNVADLFPGGISFGRGSSIASTFNQPVGFLTSKDNTTFRGKGASHGSSSQGLLGRGNQGSSGFKSTGFGRGRITFIKPEQSADSYLAESSGIYGPADVGFSHSSLQLTQESSGSAYHTNATSTFGNRNAATTTRGRSKPSRIPGRNGNFSSTTRYFSQKDGAHDTVRGYGSEKNSGWVEAWSGDASAEMKASDSNWGFGTQEADHTTLPVGYAEAANSYHSEAPFFIDYRTAPQQPSHDEYFNSTNSQVDYSQQDDGGYFAANTGNSYEYESVVAYGGMYEVDSGNTYEQYGAYGTG